MASAPPPRGTPGLDYALFSRNSSVGANAAVNGTDSPAVAVTDDDATDPLGCSLDTEPSPRSPRTPFGQIARERARRARWCGPRHYNRPPIPARASHLPRSLFWPRGLPPRPDSIHHNTRRSPRPIGARPRHRSSVDAQGRRRIFEVFRRAARLDPRRHTGGASRVSRETTRGVSHTILY